MKISDTTPHTGLCWSWTIVVLFTSVVLYKCNSEPVIGNFTNGLFIKPTNGAEVDALLILVPEDRVKGQLYIELGLLIQESATDLQLCIVILNTFPTNMDMLEVASSFLKQTRQSSRDKERNILVFLAGHGQSGYKVQTYAEFYPGTLDGIILLNSHIKMAISSFPVPVITINGELDGITRITKTAEVFREYMQEVEYSEYLKMHSPFIVFEGINHGTAISGELPEYLSKLDISSELVPREGKYKIAEALSMFLASIFDGRMTDLRRQYFEEEYNKTKQILLPLINARRSIQDEEYKSQWVSQVQMWLSDIKREVSSSLLIDSYIYLSGPDADYRPRIMERDEKSIQVFTFSDVVWSVDVADNASRPQSPKEIKSRLIGRDGIHTALYNIGLLSNKTLRRTCRDMNYASYLTAYYQVSEAARERYDKTNPGIIFQDDIRMNSLDEWIRSSLLVNADDNVLHVTSYSYETYSPEELDIAGNFIYCKLLPPLRVMEWIYIDSLRSEYFEL